MCGRVVAATIIHIRDLNSISAACGRQEDGTYVLHQGEVVSTVIVSIPTSAASVVDANRLCHRRGMYISVGKQYHTLHIGHLRLGITCVVHAIHGGSRTGVEHVGPFIFGQGSPLAFRVAAITDGVVAPVGLTRLIVEVVGLLSVCIV